MYCKDCQFRSSVENCENEYAMSESGDQPKDADRNKMMTYSYNEGGAFAVGEYFGCVHFTPKDN